MTPSLPAKLQTAGVLLVRLEQSHAELVYSALGNKDLTRWYGIELHNRNDLQKQMDWYAHLHQSGEGAWYVLTPEGNDTPVGACGIYGVNHEHRKGEIGCWLLPEGRGRGLMTAGLGLLMATAAECWNLRRIEALVEPENVHSSRLCERLGMQLEGTLRDYERKGSTFISLSVYSRLYD